MMVNKKISVEDTGTSPDFTSIFEDFEHFQTTLGQCPGLTVTGVLISDQLSLFGEIVSWQWILASVNNNYLKNTLHWPNGGFMLG